MNLVALGPTSTAPVGTTIGLGCQDCELLKKCGGTTEFDCFANCCHEPTKCTLACPWSSKFAIVVHDAGGLDISRIWSIRHASDDLPIYVPHIDSASGRSHPLPSPYVALTTFDVISAKAKRSFNTPSELRHGFRIAPNAKVLLLSIAKDNRLEQYWRFAEDRDFPKRLAKLGISHVTAPNFSFALNDPRPEHLVNRTRSLVAAERLAAAGLSVIPHVNAYNKTDYDCWRDFLRDHPQVSMVVQEFQTGLSNAKKARWHVWQLRDIEQSLGRKLKLIAVGGRRHLPVLIGLSSVTVVDSVPFIRTLKRRRLDFTLGRWQVHRTFAGESLDQLLQSNVEIYTSQVEIALAAYRKIGPILPAAEEIQAEEPIMPEPVSELQLSLSLSAAVDANSECAATTLV